MTTPTGETKPFYVALAGNIGAGKTMVTDLVGERLGWDAHYESVDDNPYLDDFYADMKRYSFHLQMYFLKERWAQQNEILSSGRSAVQDRTIYEDGEVFARILYRRGNMEERDYHTYRELYAALTTTQAAPDLILYLKTDPRTILERIAARGREFEQGIDPDYIEELHDTYEHWVERIPHITRLHVIDTDRVNLRDDPAARGALIETLRRFSREKDEQSGVSPLESRRASGGPA